MTQEEIKDLLKFIICKCDLVINNENYTADEYAQDKIEDIAEMCHRVLDGQFGETIETSKSSIPSNLDEAAREYLREYNESEFGNGGDDWDDDILITFKAGAEWMSGRFVLVGGEPTGWFRANDGSEYATGLDLEEPIKLPVDFYVRKK